MAGMAASLKPNAKGFLRGSLNPARLITDKDDRRATLDPLDLAKEPEPIAPPPPPEPVKAMPLPDDEAVKKARRSSGVRRRARSGRSSTILSDDTLG